ncbi:MAG: hypothetical protein ACOYM3_20215 [Terrimicrobiaceae bacterium]
MKRWFVAVAILLTFAGCDSPSRTVETTRQQLSAFQAAPDTARQVAVEQSLAKLDNQIQVLEQKGDTIQADLFRRQASSLRTDFQAAKVARAFNDAKNAIQGIGDAFKDAGKSFSETFKSPDTNNP